MQSYYVSTQYTNSITCSSFFREYEENKLIESLLANRSKVGKLGRPVQKASGKKILRDFIFDYLEPRKIVKCVRRITTLPQCAVRIVKR